VFEIIIFFSLAFFNTAFCFINISTDTFFKYSRNSDANSWQSRNSDANSRTVAK